MNSSTENAFLTQMLQTTSTSASTSATSTVNSSLDIASLLKKNSSSHRTVTGTLTNILPALLNGTVNASPRSASPSASSTPHPLSIVSPTSTDTLVDAKCSTSLPVSPVIQSSTGEIRSTIEATATSSSPPRCHSYPMSALSKRSPPPTVTSTVSPAEVDEDSPTSYLLATVSSCPSLVTGPSQAMFPSNSPSPDDHVPKIVRSASVKSCASDSGVSSSSPLSDNNIVHVSHVAVSAFFWKENRLSIFVRPGFSNTPDRDEQFDVDVERKSKTQISRTRLRRTESRQEIFQRSDRELRFSIGVLDQFEHSIQSTRSVGHRLRAVRLDAHVNPTVSRQLSSCTVTRGSGISVSSIVRTDDGSSCGRGCSTKRQQTDDGREIARKTKRSDDARK